MTYMRVCSRGRVPCTAGRGKLAPQVQDGSKCAWNGRGGTRRGRRRRRENTHQHTRTPTTNQKRKLKLKRSLHSLISLRWTAEGSSLQERDQYSTGRHLDRCKTEFRSALKKVEGRRPLLRKMNLWSMQRRCSRSRSLRPPQGLITSILLKVHTLFPEPWIYSFPNS